MSYILPLIITLILAPAGLWIGKKIKLMDKPGPDIIPRRDPVPTIQGIALYLVFIITVALVHSDFFSSPIVRGLLVGTTIIGIVELIDELGYLGKIPKIPTRSRILSQIVGAILAAYIGGIRISERPILGHLIYIPQRLFIVTFTGRSLLCINAINRFDGVNGQASGMSTIGFITIFLVIQFVVLPYYGHISPDVAQTLFITKHLARILSIISIVYTVIEFKPWGLLRDVGTMFLGFSLAYLSVVGGAKLGTLVVALSLVLMDAIRVGIHRIFVLKKSPMAGDYTHLHYRLLGLGRNRTEVRIVIWGWSIVLMILMLLQETNRTNKVIIFILMTFVFFMINIYLFWIKKIPCGLDIKK